MDIGDNVVYCMKCKKPKFKEGVTFIGDKKGFCNCGYDNVSGRYFGRAKQR
jgi:hypothetical protein